MDNGIPLDPFAAPRHDGVVTIWFVTTANPEAVVRTHPKADRGFGRKLLAQMDPRLPITPIGQFALNRSAKVSAEEFYISGMPGLVVVQTALEDITTPSTIDPKLRTLVPAADVYVFTENRDVGLGGFAHFNGNTLRRSFSAKRGRVYEDKGLPEPFEAPYWKGERAEPSGGIDLPFWPLELMVEAQRAWLGFDPETTDVQVAAFATDGRPEPKLAKHPQARSDQPSRRIQEASAAASAKLGFRDYDDYELAEEEEEPLSEELKVYAERAGRAFRRTASSARGGAAWWGAALRRNAGRAARILGKFRKKG
ncbi:hypothetical protein NQ015_09595 [Corynebacterium sp. 153RC1]|uniref:DUF6928 family protein n=1 Tax=unclassified Corynebacterium TaxID=2624378 RepID=UPI00211CE4FA|nr:hypothetical protein [Corynebacterium sp. 209RC1]MCQ9355533.1 hypothetical protein [Corynebacterium sp. 1222RC1]MCQ9357670.1 hypothetical protein [Corynebacterium sp. 122RC1]MCQ9359877.1 hypothetical protein [Corynebacterium sp. 142RC1]MCQ9362006.1 hypothetical protein [Corynebacterium sp. 153RC1]MCQ9364205.1 hypothetical protein [Corynebacterium sp. 732RC1]MCQ9366191.1 hypothetical protein [Corynebacterium sp. 70RC1]MCQ9371474.1 hypothetical protein [Corynebacterium sp. 35RC1]